MITEKIEKIISDQIGFKIKIQKSQRPELCDFQCNDVFKIAKEQAKSPIEIGRKIINAIKSDYFENVEFCAPGFINITVSEKFITECLNEMSNADKFGVNIATKKDLIVLDYGGANIAKPLHVGHLRSAIIGESLKRIFVFAGHSVLADVHLGDFGLQIGEVIYKVLEDKLLIENITLEYLERVYPEMSALCKQDEALKNVCADITKQLQEGNALYTKIWKKIYEVSSKDVLKIYNYLDVHFDLWQGESDAYKYIDELTAILEKKNLLQISEGAKIIDIAQHDDPKELPPVIYQKSNGAYLYDTTDMATVLERVKLYNPNEIIYTADSRQSLHYEQFFRACKKAGLVDNCKLEFCGFGTVNGLDGKPYKTRKGDAPKLDSLFEEIKQYFVNLKQDNVDMGQQDLDIIVNSIVKFADLQNNRERNYIFDIKKFSNVIGKTGPYVLYTYVRLNKMLAGEIVKELTSGSLNDVERQLKIKLLDFENVFFNAYKLRLPSCIADYVYDLCLLANSFYETNRLNSVADEKTRANWVFELNLTKNILKAMLNMLAIGTPTKM